MKNSNTEPNRERAIAVSDSAPYPEITAEHVDIKYVRWMTQDMAASNSEMSSIYMYLYQHWTYKESQPKFSETMRRIAMVEMHHLDILGTMVAGSGGSPKCRSVWGNNRAFWNGGMVSYRQNYRQALLGNIQAEQMAYNQYITQSNTCQDEQLAAVFARLAKDEQIHIDIFKKFLSEI
ncbi:ferritin-like domain-containing protein [Candidatus Soleaferrea massiliensis]|uniref:ferritin-like domain-containing protein n=1 Tax=Candidatus Soleaferrea massiliensis TaxID=1470354 RepID=UPI00059115E6|nr:ferritin family protein [Candidatus Soleaferrea massiliensis]